MMLGAAMPAPVDAVLILSALCAKNTYQSIKLNNLIGCLYFVMHHNASSLISEYLNHCLFVFQKKIGEQSTIWNTSVEKCCNKDM
jgi:hypothetical protein